MLVAKCHPHDMSQPVKLGDDLVLQARTVGTVARRSIAGLVGQRESFVFEAVLSDPVGAKVSELVEASRNGIHVVMKGRRIGPPPPRATDRPRREG